jgi:hypothetical protein
MKAATAKRIADPRKLGIEILAFDVYDEVRAFMERVVNVRAADAEHWTACPEASEIHRQLFLSSEPMTAKRVFATESWSCKGVLRAAAQRQRGAVRKPATRGTRAASP